MSDVVCVDLFGNVVRVPLKLKRVGANGYPYPPGSGPEGETCATCEFKIKVNGGRKNYWKCVKFHSPRTTRQWSGSISSDIRLASPACKLWEPALSKTPIKPNSFRNRPAIEQKELR